MSADYASTLKVKAAWKTEIRVADFSL